MARVRKYATKGEVEMLRVQERVWSKSKPKYVTADELERVRMGLVHDLEQFKSDANAELSVLRMLSREVCDEVRAIKLIVNAPVRKPWYKSAAEYVTWLWTTP